MIDHNLYGIWIGENAVICLVEDFRISFLRIKPNLITAILYHNSLGVMGVVYGHGINFDAHATMSIKRADSSIFTNSDSANSYIENHSNDIVTYDGSSNRLIYTMYDGVKYDLLLAEKIDMTEYKNLKNSITDPSLSIPEKMELWNRYINFQHDIYYVTANINTRRYSIFFNLAPGGSGHAYCRVGQNGYCDKGWAMLSTVCIRHNETRMIEDNLSSLNEYKPNEDCFVPNSCAFPSDGGWYWSIKEITDDVIYLNGCGGEVYEIYKP